jgi:hypothetical protein
MAVNWTFVSTIYHRLCTLVPYLLPHFIETLPIPSNSVHPYSRRGSVRLGFGTQGTGRARRARARVSIANSSYLHTSLSINMRHNGSGRAVLWVERSRRPTRSREPFCVREYSAALRAQYGPGNIFDNSADGFTDAMVWRFDSAIRASETILIDTTGRLPGIRSGLGTERDSYHGD